MKTQESPRALQEYWSRSRAYESTEPNATRSGLDTVLPVKEENVGRRVDEEDTPVHEARRAAAAALEARQMCASQTVDSSRMRWQQRSLFRRRVVVDGRALRDKNQSVRRPQPF